MRFVAFVVLGAVLACGGSTVTRPDAGASGDGGGSSSSGSSGGTSSGSSSSGSSGGGDAGDTCQSLVAEIDQLRPAAQTCCPTCNHAPCAYLVDDLCCPLTVDMQSSSAVTTFEQAVQQFKLLKCATLCPGIACQTKPSGVCDPTTSLCQ